jgi:hypothetical protein
MRKIGMSAAGERHGKAIGVSSRCEHPASYGDDFNT